MFNYRRTHTCGQLRLSDVKKQVTLSGWVNRRRDHGGLIFIDLRDRFGITQIVFDPVHNPNAHKLAESLRSEFVLSIKGTVRPRAEGMANPNLATGEIEIEVNEFEILSKAKTPPFSICDEKIVVNEETRLKYRYLDLRRGDILDKLIKRHQACLMVREYLNKEGFVEVQTPMLGKSTPEGSRDYLVPSRVSPGSFYALPQSPQLYKQLLMVGGLDRYFQIATCFRDEDLRADRQPEFTQIDIEMSFVTPEDLFPIIEGMLKDIFKNIAGFEPKTPFRHMTYQEAMEKYGTDKPDLRFGMELSDVSDIAAKSSFSVFLEGLQNGNIVKGFKATGDFSRKTIDELTTFVSQFGIKGLAWMKMQAEGLQSNIVKFFPDEQQKALIERFDLKAGDIVFLIADTKDKANQGLDHLRRKVAKDLGLMKNNEYAFVWVREFPCFGYNEEEKRLESMHHPFTSPFPEDIHLLDTDPLKIRSSGYDIVLNGYEIGGGSQRIHNGDLQEKIFEALKLTPKDIEEKFGFFVDALKYGTPPHLGIALGLDRVIMLATGTDNIRDVIAFPKTQKASDLMNECPSPVSREQLNELKIAIKS